MVWRDVYPELKNKESFDLCKQVALACCEHAKNNTNNAYILETIELLKNNSSKEVLNSRASRVAVIRSKETENKVLRESAHIVIHALEVAIANNSVSASGHAARCMEALSRIDEQLERNIYNSLVNKSDGE